jgi:hypothetical protein
MYVTNSDGGTEYSPAILVYRQVGKCPYSKSLNSLCLCVNPWEEMSESFVDLAREIYPSRNGWLCRLLIEHGLRVQESLTDPWSKSQRMVGRFCVVVDFAKGHY